MRMFAVCMALVVAHGVVITFYFPLHLVMVLPAVALMGQGAIVEQISRNARTR